MTEGQRFLIQLLGEIDEICKKHDIHYYLAGGTIIGALRHRGCIPWDDDADIYMTRKEFLKLLKLAESGEFAEGRIMGCQERSRTYRNVFARYIDTTTSAIHKAQMGTKDEAGIVIDVFQLDPVPDDEKLQKKHYRDLLLYTDLTNEYAPFSHRVDENQYRYPFYKLLVRVFGLDFALKKIEKRLLKYDEDDCDHYMMRWGGAPLLFPKKMFQDYMRVDMEGIDAMIPKDYNEYLIYHYGDEWMYLPHVSEQMGHDAVYSTEHNYEDVRALYQPLVDEDALRNVCEKRKSSMIKNAAFRHRVTDTLVTLRGIRCSHDILADIKNKKINLKKLYKDKKFESIRKLFANYYLLQGHASFSGRDTYTDYYRYQKPVLIELPPDILDIALKTLCNLGRTSKAARTLQIYEKIHGAIPKELQDLKKAIDLQREGMDEYSYSNKEKAIEILRESLKLLPYNTSVIKLLTRALIETGGKEKEIRALIKRGRVVLPEDGDFIKFEADMMYGEDKQKAVQMYLSAKELTSNGFELLDIGDRIDEYVEELRQRMIKKSFDNKKDEIDKIYNKILKFKPEAEESVYGDYLECILYSNITQEEAFDHYRTARAMVLENYESISEKTIKKAMLASGETLRVSDLHCRVLKTLNEGEDQNDTLLEYIKACMEDDGFKDVEKASLKKLAGDLYKFKGNIIQAYELYRDAFFDLPETSLAFKEIREMFERDLKSIKNMADDNIDRISGKKLQG